MTPIEIEMPDAAFANLGEVTLAYYDTDIGRGPPVMFCHGFPELAFSWRHQLSAFVAAGRRGIALDQRGYGLSDRPDAVEAYDIVHLTDDLARLLDHLGIAKAIFCGHDWGGIVVWQMALLHPDRVAGVIGLNTPFMPRSLADPIEIMRRRFGDDMYIVHFQKPGEADDVLAKNVGRTMDFFMRRPVPGAAPASAGITGGNAERPPRPEGGSVFPLVKMLQAWDPAADPRPGVLTPEEMAVFVRSFQRTGFTGGINWYRNFSRNWRLTESQAQRVEAPSLMILAEKDAFLPPSGADGMETYVPDLEKQLVLDSGHWTQQEQPEAVNRLILDWLDRRFPR
ncbi:MAG: alpha/beta hydrolase [Caulobacteraceae bacterium]|nr:alpha/beta hydrolase [Caulobacteraceae bacterium]